MSSRAGPCPPQASPAPISVPAPSPSAWCEGSERGTQHGRRTAPLPADPGLTLNPVFTSPAGPPPGKPKPKTSVRVGDSLDLRLGRPPRAAPAELQPSPLPPAPARLTSTPSVLISNSLTALNFLKSSTPSPGPEKPRDEGRWQTRDRVPGMLVHPRDGVPAPHG